MKWLFVVCWSVMPALATLAAPSARAQAVCTRSAMTVLRKGPGTKFEKSWVVSKYMPFLKVELKNGWLKLQDVDGQIHYGRASDFSQSIRCVVVRVNTAETRQGPGTRFPYGDFKTLDRYTPLKRISMDGNWVQVENDLGMKSWIQDSKLWHPVKMQSVKF